MILSGPELDSRVRGNDVVNLLSFLRSVAVGLTMPKRIRLVSDRLHPETSCARL
jgi:hypothetical protein